MASLTQQSDPATTSLSAQCHCKSVHITITLPTALFPLKTHLCHCHICRRVHGSLSCFHAPLPNGIQPVFSSPSNPCIRYIHSPGAACARLFCSTCGCHIGDEDLEPDPSTNAKEWRIAASIFPSHPPSQPDNPYFLVASHFYPPSDPSLPTWLPSFPPHTTPLPRWTPTRSDPMFPLPPPSPPPAEVDGAGNPVLRAECHCGGVSFTLPRPSHPSLAGCGLTKRYTSPTDKEKWLATLDLCSDCRLTTGTHVMAWTFVPLDTLRPTIPEALEGFGTLKAYHSSPDVMRGFCGTCGATCLFLSDEEERKGEAGRRIVDVAVGILRGWDSERGEDDPAALEWVTWRTGRIAFWKSGKEYDPLFAEGLARGLRVWGEESGGLVECGIPREL